MLRSCTRARRLVNSTHHVFYPCTVGFLFKLHVILVLHGLTAPFFLVYQRKRVGKESIKELKFVNTNTYIFFRDAGDHAIDSGLDTQMMGGSNVH